MTRPLHRPAPPVAVLQAQAVLARPGPDLSDELRLMAWHILKSERGQRIDQARLRRDQRARRATSARARALAARHICTPAAFGTGGFDGGDAA